MTQPNDRPRRALARLITWCPLLIGPAAVAVVAVATLINGAPLDVDAPLDFIAPWVLLAAFALYVVRGIATRNPLYVLMIVAGGVLLLRELHWSPAIKVAAPILIVTCLVWILTWRDLLAVPFRNDRRHVVWLIAAAVAYALAQIIERRVFKFIPGEADMHSKIEESVEVAGHLAVLIAALIGNWRYYDLTQRVCSISEGFVIGPTGKLWRRLTGKSDPPPAEPNDEDQI